MYGDVDAVVGRLAWMRHHCIWPNGYRYLWTDAFGVVTLVGLYHRTGDVRWADEARWVVREVDRVLGRGRGLRIGDATDRDGQYYHYLAVWLFALWRMSELDPVYRRRAIELVEDIHEAFVLPGLGVYWKMVDDLSAPYPGYGLGSLDAFQGYVVYRLLDEERFANEISAMRRIVDRNYESLVISQDLGLGVMLWLTHFFPDEPWAVLQRQRSLAMLDQMWVDPPGYFCRHPHLRSVKYAFTNHGISIGLQAAAAMSERPRRIDAFFESYRSGDLYDSDAITHVMACAAALPDAFLVRTRSSLDRVG